MDVSDSSPAERTDPAAQSLVDHHCHGVVTGPLDPAGFELMLTEAVAPAPAGTTFWDTQLGIAIRAWCAPVLDLPPHAPPADYLARRTELGGEEVARRLLRASGISAYLLDAAHGSGVVAGVVEMGRLADAAAHEVVRLEAVAESLAVAGMGAGEFFDGFPSALASAANGAVGLKSVIAYRLGLDFDPSRPGRAEVTAAAGGWLWQFSATGSARLEDPVLLRHLLWSGVDLGLPLQFHVGFGDPDVRLHRADPSLMTDFLLAVQDVGTEVLLLHCYPFHRQAGYLANVFPHVSMDVGMTLNHVGARSAAVVAESLELAPFHKVLFSSDAYGLPELYYLGAELFRRGMARVCTQWVEEGSWSAADAQRVVAMVGGGNAARIYRLVAG